MHTDTSKQEHIQFKWAPGTEIQCERDFGWKTQHAINIKTNKNHPAPKLHRTAYTTKHDTNKCVSLGMLAFLVHRLKKKTWPNKRKCSSVSRNPVENRCCPIIHIDCICSFHFYAPSFVPSFAHLTRHFFCFDKRTNVCAQFMDAYKTTCWVKLSWSHWLDVGFDWQFWYRVGRGEDDKIS